MVWAQRSMEADFTDLAFFTALIRALDARGVATAIASFGRYEVIQAYLDKAFGVPQGAGMDAGAGGGTPRAAADAGGAPRRLFSRSNISTPAAVGGKDGWSMQGGKNVQLNALLEQFGATMDTTLFFDGE
jgi:hypothetical protein